MAVSVHSSGISQWMIFGLLILIMTSQSIIFKSPFADYYTMYTCMDMSIKVAIVLKVISCTLEESYHCLSLV